MIADYKSYRNKDGSVYIRSLCEKVKEYGKVKDLVWILTRVNHLVSQEVIIPKELNQETQSPTNGDSFTKCYQASSFLSTLTKDVVFRDK